ncbi:MAG: alanine--tRNA ligase, partial [Legionellales bacterium]|nr:alanine--tRNA ligase [Legionellales bacterium]
VNEQVRQATMLTHSATHLLHAALRQILGEHVMQKGSLVAPDRLRFDFTHPQPVTAAQLTQIEQWINTRIRANVAVQVDVLDVEEAKKSGALALFGEKYADRVRVLTMGDFSKELCGGTHVRRTGDIGLCRLISETGIAAGVRRIEAVTGQGGLDWIDQQTQCLEEIANRLKTQPQQVVVKLTQFLDQLRQLEKDNEALQTQLLDRSGDQLLNQAIPVNGVTVLATHVDNVAPKALRNLLDQLRDRIEPAVIVLAAVNNDKVNVVAGVSKSLIGQVPSARDLVKAICQGGGGRDDMAQGGGDKPADLDRRLADILKMVENYPKSE